MKKRKFLLIFIIILLINLISASYNCSNESSMLIDQDEIEIGKRGTINGLGLGLVYADEIAVLKRMMVEIIVDAKKVLLSNETSSEEVELLSGDYTVSLINITGDTAIIKVGGNSGLVNKAEWTTINNLKVFLVNAEGSYPGQGNIEVIVGINLISLSNDENPIQVITINEKDYLLELFSASDSDAGIIVKKCETGNIIEIQDSEEVDENMTTNLTTNNSTLENSSAILGNSTIVNQSEQTSGTNENITETEKKGLEINSLLKGKFLYVLIFFIVIIVVIVIFLIVYTKIKSNNESKELINTKNSS